MKEEFKNIYDNKIWYKGSGSGSLPVNTEKYRELLQKYILDKKIKSVLDIGCGDWGFSNLMDWSDIQYLGVDVVESVIEQDKKLWSNNNIQFKCIDSFNSELPQVDLVILKDVFQHWSNQCILEFLPKLNNFQHVLITNTCEGEGLNSDIENGGFRPINLCQPPFNQKINELIRYQSKRIIKNVWETKNTVELIVKT